MPEFMRFLACEKNAKNVEKKEVVLQKRQSGGMRGGAGGTFGGLEELVKLVKLGIGQKVLGIWNWAFDKNYNAYSARTAPRRGRGRRIHRAPRIPPGHNF